MNLPEQGRLLRQDEFLVWQGWRKSLRRVFLFEDLILFSKTKRGRQGHHDIYVHKFSFKVGAAVAVLTTSHRGKSVRSWCDGSSDRSSMVDPLSYFSFQPVLHDWCNKSRGMCYPVCGMVYIKEPLLLIGKCSPCGSSGFPLSLSEWSFTICLMPYNRE